MLSLKFDPNTDPNFIVSSLPDYVEQNRDLLIKDAAFGASTIDYLNIQTGIKTSAKINFLSADPVFQDGSTCGFTPDNTTELTQREIVTGLIKVNESYCPDTLLGKWAEYLVRIPEPQRAELPFERYIIEVLTGGIRKKLDLAIWQGDTTSADPTLKWFDGFLTLIAADAGITPITVPAGSSAYDAIKSVVLAIPAVDLWGGRARVFVAPDLYRTFLLELVEKNLYHYSGPQNAAPNSFVFPGSNVEVVAVYGLTGSNSIVASTSENLFYGTDIENAREQFKVVYDEKDELFYVKVRWNSGVQYAFSDRVVLAEYTTIDSGSGISKALDSIAESAAALADDDHIYKTKEQA